MNFPMSDKESRLNIIMSGINQIANKYAIKIGWDRGTERLQKCLHCTQGCHYSRFSGIKDEFWQDLWALLTEHGIDPVPIQEARRKKLAEKPWTTTMPDGPEDIKRWISEQL